MAKHFSFTTETPRQVRQAIARTANRHDRRATRCALRAAVRGALED